MLNTFIFGMKHAKLPMLRTTECKFSNQRSLLFHLKQLAIIAGGKKCINSKVGLTVCFIYLCSSYKECSPLNCDSKITPCRSRFLFPQQCLCVENCSENHFFYTGVQQTRSRRVPHSVIYLQRLLHLDGFWVQNRHTTNPGRSQKRTNREQWKVIVWMLSICMAANFVDVFYF